MRCFIFLALLVVAANAQYKLCVTDKINENTCLALQRGDSKVSCLRVTDSAECAIRLSTGEADFGVFNAEELLLAYQFYPNAIVPIYQLKHKDRMEEEFQFQSVAVVPSTYTPSQRGNNFDGLRNEGFCHPGFSQSQWWNDYILKYFERKVVNSECRADLTAVENEAENIKQFFGSACRPGEWATEDKFNRELQKKHPELCTLCDYPESCSYKSQGTHGHMGALDCLTSKRGKVAYVALNYVRQYFKDNSTYQLDNSTYQFLCPDGTTKPLSTDVPCAWIKQPWGVIAARKSIAKTLADSLNGWLTPTYSAEHWTLSLNTILQEDSLTVGLEDGMSIASYLSKGREVDLPNAQTCKRSPLRWCTTSDLENHKCQWVATEAKALGIEPQIVCTQAESTFECFRDIASNKSDIMTIDSNYGHLARTVFGLTTVLYSETEKERSSVVVAVTREASDNPIKDFESLQGRKACFPEYGGIAWLSFVNIARTNGIISSKSCDYPKLVAKLLSGACTPGIQDNNHSNKTDAERRPEITSVLCSSCMSKEVNASCAASENNPYYGDHGALKCLKNGGGDIAFIERRNLKDDIIKSNEYRILCQNGSLASSPGFNFDEYCPLSVTIDSEIVGRRNSSDIDTLDTVLALLKIENWLGYSVRAERPIRIYDQFNGTKDLLFKDSTTGLVKTSSTVKTVIAYKDLFRHVDTCSGAMMSVIANLGLIITVALSAIHFSQVL